MEICSGHTDLGDVDSPRGNEQPSRQFLGDDSSSLTHMSRKPDAWASGFPSPMIPNPYVQWGCGGWREFHPGRAMPAVAVLLGQSWLQAVNGDENRVAISSGAASSASTGKNSIGGRDIHGSCQPPERPLPGYAAVTPEVTTLIDASIQVRPFLYTGSAFLPSRTAPSAASWPISASS
jgi:hypothetical protein